MKFALSCKYDQNPSFRDALEESKGLYIVEDQTTFSGSQANTWGTKLVDGYYVGPNLMGQLLMELRDNGLLAYSLPQDLFDIINTDPGRNLPLP